MEKRKISAIAGEILNLWIAECGTMGYQKKYYTAVQQLQGLLHMETVDSNYGMDSGRGVLGSFLCNVTNWKGEDARRIKKELNLHLKGKI